MADEGYYRSDGIQNTGTALTVNNQDVTIFTGTDFRQIYPREISATIGNGNFGGFSTSTYRTVGGWRDCAYQGAKSVGKTNQVRICYGHIVPSAIPRFANLVSVDYVRIGFQPHRCGQHGAHRTLVFRVGLNGDATPPMEVEWRYGLGAGQDGNYQVVEEYASGSTSSLPHLMHVLLTRGNRLMLFNGETSVDRSASYWDGSGYGSHDYAAIESFEIQEIRLKYRP